MNCREFEQYAERWMEGERGEADVHFRECPLCRGFVADLEAIRMAAPLLAEDVVPAPRLWTSIRAQLEREGLIRRGSWREQFADWFWPAPRPVLAGALVGLMATAILLVYSNHPVMPEQPASVWTASNEHSFGNLANQLNKLEQRAVPVMHEHNPVVEASFHRNLAIVDNSIEMCEKAVRETPGDEMARDYLYDAYEQKADLLNTIAERGSATR